MVRVPPLALTPPEDLVRRVGGNAEIGDYQVSDLVRCSDLTLDDKILDVGSGVGLTAEALLRITDPLGVLLKLTSDRWTGRYDGFDVQSDAIDWCQREITPSSPNFNFQHVDVWDPAYNPKGKIQPHEFVFPYPDESFSLVTAFSLFTQFEEPATRRYLEESYRVLEPGGRLHATFYLAKRNVQSIPKDRWQWLRGHDEEELRTTLSTIGFEVKLISYGSWPEGGELERAVPGLQDTVVAYK